MQQHSPCLGRPDTCRNSRSIDLGVTGLIFAGSSESEISRCCEETLRGLKMLLEVSLCESIKSK